MGNKHRPTAKLPPVACGLLAAVFWLGLWCVLANSVGQELLLPSPMAVIKRLAELLRQREFWAAAGLTLLRIMAGFLLAIITGTLIATLTFRYRLLNTLLRPIQGIVKATPVVSFILLAQLWLRSGTVPMLCTFLMVLPAIWANVYTGIENTDRQLLEMAQVYGFSFGRKLRYIYIPSVMPYFIAAFTTGLGMGWKAGIAAEVISRPELSIGIQMYYSKIYLETADLFAWTVVVIAVSMALEKAFIALGRRMGARYNVV